MPSFFEAVLLNAANVKNVMFCNRTVDKCFCRVCGKLIRLTKLNGCFVIIITKYRNYPHHPLYNTENLFYDSKIGTVEHELRISGYAYHDPPNFDIDYW